jgi:hypothetical protein
MTIEPVSPMPPRSVAEIIRVWWPYLVGIASAAAFLFTWMGDQRKMEENRRVETENRRMDAEKLSQLRLLEAKKPFLDKQLALYFETAQVVGNLVSLKPESEGWKASLARYWQLYWSELSMVEHRYVETGMAAFGHQLKIFERDPTEYNKGQLNDLAYKLAHRFRAAIEEGWGVSDVKEPDDGLGPQYSDPKSKADTKVEPNQK